MMQVYSKYDYGLKVFDMSFDTEEYPLLSMRNWDMDRIRASKKLPARLNLKVENLEIALCGSTIEYFYIVMKSTD